MLMRNDRGGMFACKVAIAPGVVPVCMAVDAEYCSPLQFSTEQLHHSRDVLGTEHCVEYYHVKVSDNGISINFHPFEFFHAMECAPKYTYTLVATHFGDSNDPICC